MPIFPEVSDGGPAIVVTSNDVLSRWIGQPLDLDADKLQRLIDDVVVIIGGEVPNLAAYPADRIKLVVSRIVIRYLRNPEGIRQFSKTQGPFTTSATYSGVDPGEIEMTAKDRSLLTGARRRQRAFGIDTW